jgi:hypothetical protein
MNEFVRWVADSPSGPAWHAVLETDEGAIVGHTSLFPMRVAASGVFPLKSEYSFLLEAFRKEKIRGCEGAGRPPFIILLDKLFRHCLGEGWGPIFASTNEKNQVFTRRVGLRQIEFPLSECLLVLRPGRSARLTPNLSKWQRAGVFSAGLAHGLVWPLAARWQPIGRSVHEMELHKNGFKADPERPLAFFEDSASLMWRYPQNQYTRFGSDASTDDYVLAKNGSPDRFLRVVQYNLKSIRSFSPLFAGLVRKALEQQALGVRWAVYDTDPMATELVSGLKKRGLICARRERIVMIHKAHEQYLETARWKMSDSLFSFDP